MRLEFLQRAIRDLEAIGDYIALDNPRRAASFIRELREHCRKITLAPSAYRPRPELGPGLRSCAFGNYVIFFEQGERAVRIIRILHGAMDIEERFVEKQDRDIQK